MEALRPRRNQPEVPVRPVADGVWWCRAKDVPHDLYFTVAGRTLQLVSKAEAYCALGAVERLHAMGLGDAAVSLQAGDFDHASVQVIAERERLKGS